jgi:medium-chain acyl-[acyl-carrier-protein] hydrolase
MMKLQTRSPVDYRVLEPCPDAALRLICLPYAGAGASIFRAWPTALPGIEVLAARLPGREGRLREPMPRTWRALVEQSVDALLPSLRGPYALFGHSMGAVLALAVARELSSRGAPRPEHLIVSGRPAPDRAPRWLGAAAALADGPLLEELERRFGGLAGTLLDDPEVRDVVLPTLRADFLLLDAARDEAADLLACDVTVYGGSGDPTTPLDDLVGWQSVSRGRFRLKLFPGGHFFLNDRRDSLLRDIRATLGGAGCSAT